MVYVILCYDFFFCKQRTAYDVRISDWSSDVCSSDLPASLLDRVAEKIKLMSGAAALVDTLKQHGVYCALVSGGFDHYTVGIAAQLGFDEQQANHLIVEDGAIAGIREPILGREAKLEAQIGRASCRERVWQTG